MPTISFDGPNKIVTIGYSGAITNLNATDIYSRWKDWVADDHAQYAPAFAESVGGNDLGSGVGLGQYVFFKNDTGWRITAASYDYEVRISGDLYPVSTTAAMFTPVSGKTVLFTVQRSVGSTTVETGGSSTTPEDIAIAVWDRPMTDHTTSGSFGKRIKELLPTLWGIR